MVHIKITFKNAISGFDQSDVTFYASVVAFIPEATNNLARNCVHNFILDPIHIIGCQK
jgi:hypothetical protein